MLRTAVFYALLALSSVLPVAWRDECFALDGGATPRVLILYENESTLPAAMDVASGLRDSLEKHLPVRREVYSEYLDTVRFPARDHIDRLASDLSAKYSGIKLDAVLAVGPGALQFILGHRDQIAPGVPIVFGGVTQPSAADAPLPANSKGVISHFDVRKTIDLARQLQPDAKSIVVMTGSSAFDESWQATARHELGDRYANLDVRYVSGLSLDGFAAAASKLGKDTILLVLTVFQDAEGHKFVPRDAADIIVPASRVPAYTVYGTYIGTGVVGGYAGTFHGIGEEMGRLAGEVMNGNFSSPQTTAVPEVPLIDWRQIVKWGIDPNRVPADAEIVNRAPTAWELYRTEIVAALTVIVLQSAMIIVLIVQERKRRRISAELTLERLELAHLSRSTQLGALSGAFAHELNQPLTAILANSEAGSRILEADAPDLPELKEIFADITTDNRRAVSILAQLRRLMVKGETTADLLDLNQAVSATMALARSELIARRTTVAFERDATEVPVRANLPQLQQIILNLVFNAADAMEHLPPSDRQIEIRTRKREDGFGELAVSDQGPGVAPDVRENIFKPFVSTKKDGLGLGLAICSVIARAHGGTLRIDEGNQKGARLVLALPQSQR